MIKIGNDWEIHTDPTHGLQVKHYRMGLNKKTKKMVRSSETTYHPNFEQSFKYILDREIKKRSKDCVDAKSLIKVMLEVQGELLEAVQSFQNKGNAQAEGPAKKRRRRV